MIRVGGRKVTTRTKLTGTIIPAKMPKAFIGMMSQNIFAKKATDVVDDVMKIALADLLNVYAIRF